MIRLKQVVILSFSLIVLSACSSKDTQFCTCLNTSEQLNELSNDLLTTTITEAKAKKLVHLKKLKKEQCLDYVHMDGQAMLERKKVCLSVKK